jgi:hypothetical protein
MPINSVLGSGLQGVQNGFSTVNRAAEKIARVDTSENPSGDLAQSAVSLEQGKRQVEASAKVIETHNETVGSLIDIKV